MESARLSLRSIAVIVGSLLGSLYPHPGISQSTYVHTPNAAISGHNTRTLSNVSVEACKAVCSQESWCKSFDFHKGKAKCDLSNMSAQDVGGLKTNYKGNPYDHYAKHIVDTPRDPLSSSSTSITETNSSSQAGFQVFPNAAISGHNTRTLSNVSVAACKAACSQETWCKSFDFHKGKAKCDLSNMSAQDVGGLKTNYKGNPYDHYSRMR
jgi:hypothetical protein